MPLAFAVSFLRDAAALKGREKNMNQGVVNKTVLAVMVIAITALFLSMIHQFLMAIILAGLFSAMARPIYRRFRIPLLLLVGIIVGQAIDVGQTVTPWIKQNLEQPDKLTAYLQGLPFYEYLEPYRGIILEKAGAGNVRHGQLPVHDLRVSVHNILFADGRRQTGQKDSVLPAIEQRR
jgi:uncharacterized membrane protein YvlD (DUF360 family)